MVNSLAYAITKENIIALSKAGASDDTIITHIRIQCCPPMEISEIEDIIKEGVSQKVVEFVITNQEKMPAYCEHSEKHKQLQELKKNLEAKYKNTH
jgi:hypothetical protein